MEQPIIATVVNTEGECMSNCTSDPILSKLSDEVPIQAPSESEEEIKKSKKFLKNLQTYIKSDKFVKDCNDKASRVGVSPKKVAKTYIGKVAGIIGDTLGIAIDTVNIGAVGLIDLISSVLTKFVNLVCNVARGIVAFLTGNRTNKPVSA